MSTQHHPHHHHHHHHQASESESSQIKTAEDNAIRFRAYEIYREKGGYALDNWLEAERTLKNAGKK